MKIQDLLEAAVGKSPTLKLLKDKQKAIDYIKANCSDMLPNIKSGKVYWRADYEFEKKLGKNEISLIVDPSKTVRKSENTSNQYTEIFDNHPEMKDWPKRSRSYVCATTEQLAEEFGTPFVIIPLNGVKIGFTNRTDIWHFEFKLFDEDTTVEDANYLLESIGVTDWGSLVKLDKGLKANEEWANDALDNGNENLLKYKKKLLETILAVYSPKKQKFTLGKSGSWKFNQEIWIGGPCVVLKRSFYEELNAELNGKKYEPDDEDNGMKKIIKIIVTL